MLHCRLAYHRDKGYLILDIMAEIFPKILAKSSIRPDLVECFRTPTLAAAYLKEDLIASAITTYISVSNFIAAHLLCLTHSQRSDGGAENIPKFLRHVESQVILTFLRPRVISILSLLHSMLHQYQYLIANLRSVIASSYPPLVMTELGMNSQSVTASKEATKSANTNSRRPQNSVVSCILILVMIVVPNSGDCL